MRTLWVPRAKIRKAICGHRTEFKHAQNSPHAQAWRQGRGSEGYPCAGSHAAQAGAPFDPAAIRGTAQSRIRRRARQPLNRECSLQAHLSEYQATHSTDSRAISTETFLNRNFSPSLFSESNKCKCANKRPERGAWVHAARQIAIVLIRQRLTENQVFHKPVPTYLRPPHW